ncbi:Ferredoxin / Ferredoxin--NAD(+) reductase [Pararobbsia alpina]|uniref:benzoate 1,2-dioxygenase electron transfer component BenC n=1 Tax=Pararobbsia alpina TaxID=621374 RepID=UPI0039A6BC44
MNHSIALQFEDGTTRFIDCAEDETLADAAYRQGVNVPLDCRDGACGTCKGHCESGRYDGGSYIEDALSDDEARDGFVLACQMRPKSDCVVRIAASAAACKTGVSEVRGTLQSLNRDTATTLTFSIALEGERALDFLPGQYANVTIPGSDETRAYSFSSPPGASHVSFLVRDVPDGKMSRYLRHEAALATSMQFKGPFGSFYLREVKRPVVMLAGGTGLAPFLSMLASLAAREETQPIHLVYGVTNDADLVGIDEIERFAAQLPNFTYSTCVASDASAHPRKGYVTAHLPSTALHDGNVDIYVCGPPPMVEAVRHWLKSNQIEPANFYFEKFAPSTVGVEA